MASRTSALVVIAVLAAGGLTILTGPPSQAAAPSVVVADSDTVVRPTGTPTGLPASASLVAAGNEYESFQLVVEGPATAVSVSGDLFGWGATEAYREDYYDATRRSDMEGGTGRWPDALIPATDLLYGEDRNAFPLQVPAGENRVVWVDVFVPPGTAPGTYTDSLTVSGNGSEGSVPVSLEVLDWSMPSTSTLDNVFMVQAVDGGGNEVCLAHTGSKTCGGDKTLRAQLNSLYTRVALENRLTVGNGFGTDYGDTSALYQAADWETYLEGPDIRGGSAYPAGAQLHLQAPEPTRVSAYAYANFHCLTTCANQWEAEATEAGQDWSPKMLWYGCDEAGASDAAWTSCDTNLQQAQDGWTRPALVNATLSQYLDHAPAGMDVSTIATYVDLMQVYQQGSIRPSYDAWLGADPSRSLWLATACNAFGCGDGDTTHEMYRGLPGYAIDAPANASRAMPWMIFRERATGELNWSTTKRLSTAWNADGLFESGGNGDGTMFYPGTVDRIGGLHDIPLESMRLKHLRDGREDYEYMAYLADHGFGPQVRDLVESVYPDMRAATIDKDGSGPGSLLEARAGLVELMRQANPVGPGTSGRIIFSSDRDGDAEIYSMAPNGTDVRQMTFNSVADEFPAFSQDSTRISWTQSGQVWVMDADGTAKEQVTHAALPAQKAAWTPDGQLVYVQTVEAGRTELWQVAADGTDPQVVLSAGPDLDVYDPDIDSEGSLYYSQEWPAADGGGAHVWRKDLGQPPVELSYGSIDEAVSVSPDRGQISYSKVGLDWSGQYDVYLKENVEGPGNGTNLTATVAGGDTDNDFQSVFSPDSLALAFSSTADGDAAIWRMDADTTHASALTDGQSHDVDPDWGTPAVLPPTSVPLCLGHEVTVDLGSGQSPSSGDDVVLGTKGADVISTLAGDDIVCGRGGNDVLRGGSGNDRLDGGAGTDVASYSDAGGGVMVSLSLTSAQGTGGGGTDTLTGVENLVGSPAGDRLVGNAGPNRLSGGAGGDTLIGKAGRDVCRGGSGKDTARSCERTTSVP